MQRIALWNTAFLGDAVLTLPLLQSLRLRYPDAQIDFYVRKGVESLFVHHPAINTVYAFDKRRSDKGPSGSMRFASQIARRGYDLWISAHTSPRSAFMALASRARIRIGYAAPWWNKMAYTHLVERRFNELEEIERLLELLRPLGEGAVSHWPEIFIGEEEKRIADEIFAPFSGPVLGMHPGSTWPTKRWPVEFFADIGLRALRGGANVLLFAGPGEENIANNVRIKILQDVNKSESLRLHDFSNRLSLPMLTVCLSKLSCYLTNDSGPMHIAWALHTPVTALFGPTVRELGFFPRGDDSTVLEKELSCRPCSLHGPQSCPLGHHNCMRQLIPNYIWNDVNAKLWPENLSSNRVTGGSQKIE